LDEVFDKWQSDPVFELPSVALTGIVNIIQYLSAHTGPEIREALNNGLNGPAENLTKIPNEGTKPIKINLASERRD